MVRASIDVPDQRDKVPDEILDAIDRVIRQNEHAGTIRVPVTQLPGPLYRGYAPEPTWTWDDVLRTYRDQGWTAAYHDQPPGDSYLLLQRPLERRKPASHNGLTGLF